jgi:hypothetical protein
MAQAIDESPALWPRDRLRPLVKEDIPTAELRTHAFALTLDQHGSGSASDRRLVFRLRNAYSRLSRQVAATEAVATSDNVMVGACVSRNAVPRHAGNRQAQVYGLPMHPQRPQLNAAEIECM